ncbi:MAG: exodeoxyribonuclease VII large subunit, partial [Aldersonia sp.]|nr:exodeoxyribonuclease VII large subunit [Aldersonia sp.]
VQREERMLAQVRSRPALADPLGALTHRHDEIERLRQAARRDLYRSLDVEETTTRHLRERLATLGPAATLARGYAVVQRVGIEDPHVVRSIADAPPGAQLRIRVADGAVTAASLGAKTDD